jgi:hypothetical protein
VQTAGFVLSPAAFLLAALLAPVLLEAVAPWPRPTAPCQAALSRLRAERDARIELARREAEAAGEDGMDAAEVEAAATWPAYVRAVREACARHGEPEPAWLREAGN